MLEIQRMVDNYKVDRPVMNRQDTFERLVFLLREEVDEFTSEPSGQELADIIFCSLALANDLGLDIEKEVREKMAYNMLRYVAEDFQQGEYSEARRRSKAREKEVKPMFYND